MYARVNGAGIYFDVEGNGYAPLQTEMISRPVCFALHGGPGAADHTTFKPWLSPMSEHLQLVYHDFRGHGRSEETGAATYSINQMANDLEALREYLGLGKIVVLGTSFGGMVAQVYAIRYPDAVEKLVLASTTPSSDFWEEARPMVERIATPEQQEILAKNFEGRMETDEEFEQGLRLCLPLYLHRTNQRAIDEMLGRMTARRDVSNHMMVHELPYHEVRKDLKHIQIKTLVLTGRHDWIAPISQAKAIHERVPDSELVIFENSSHIPFIEEQEAFNQTVTDFVLGNKLTSKNGRL